MGMYRCSSGSGSGGFGTGTQVFYAGRTDKVGSGSGVRPPNIYWANGKWKYNSSNSSVQCVTSGRYRVLFIETETATMTVPSSNKQKAYITKSGVLTQYDLPCFGYFYIEDDFSSGDYLQFYRAYTNSSSLFQIYIEEP